MEEIQSDGQLQQFYMRNGILENARKPIQVDDLASLGLDLEEQGLMRTGRRLHTGTGFGEWEWETTPMTKGKRYICLDHDSQEEELLFLEEYNRLGLP